MLVAARHAREAAGADGRAGRRASRQLLDDIQQNALRPGACAFREEHTTERVDLRRVQADHGRPPRLRRSRRGAASAECEAQIKTETQATIRNLPLEERAGGRVRAVRPAGSLEAPGSRRRTSGIPASLQPAGSAGPSSGARSLRPLRAHVLDAAACRSVRPSRRTISRNAVARCARHQSWPIPARRRPRVRGRDRLEARRDRRQSRERATNSTGSGDAAESRSSPRRS